MSASRSILLSTLLLSSAAWGQTKPQHFCMDSTGLSECVDIDSNGKIVGTKEQKPSTPANSNENVPSKVDATLLKAFNFALTAKEEGGYLSIGECVVSDGSMKVFFNGILPESVRVGFWDNNKYGVKFNGPDKVGEFLCLSCGNKSSNEWLPIKEVTSTMSSSSDLARIYRAWKYIYSHGCHGESSPF